MVADLQVAIGLVLVAALLTTAVVRPFGIGEGLVAVPCALLALLAGSVSAHSAGESIRHILPTVCFLAAILTFSHLCATAGVFGYLGNSVARWSRGRPTRLLALVVVFAAGVTATLTLDSTVVLVTPVVLATTRQLGVTARPHSYACVHLANSGSLLLPVSNLTNLLAFTASGLSFGRFTAVMALPWLVSCALDWATLRVVFRRDLLGIGQTPLEAVRAPVYALAVFGLTVTGFVITTALGVAPAWAALAGSVALGIDQLRRRRTTGRQIVLASSPGFCLFVVALAVLVAGVLDHGAESWLRHLIPSGTGLIALLGLAFVAAVLANLINNLPTTLALLPLLTGSPLAVLAVLVGVNLGPNAAYPGSLATLLWRRGLPPADKPLARQFHLIGLSSTPVVLVAATTALWLVAAPLNLR